MPVTWDSPLTATVAAELDAALRGARLRALHLDHDGGSALFFLRETTLALRLASDEGEIVLQDAAEDLEEARPLASEVVSVEAPPDDRVLLIRLRRVRGRHRRYLVAVELITNRWNVVVAEGEERRIRHLLREQKGARPLAVGGTYEPPEPSGREGRNGVLPLERWEELLGDVPPEDRRRILLTNVAWTSALNAEWILGEEASAEGLAAVRDRWLQVVDAVAEPEPVLLHRPDGGLQPYPLPLHGVEATPADSLLDALRRTRVRATGLPGPVAVPSSWLTAVEEEVRSAEGRVRGLARELEKAPDPEAIRSVGDLLLARFHEVPTGAETVTLTGFDGERVEVELDPTLPPNENADLHYERAAKAERARKRLPRLLSEARQKAERARSFMERVRRGDATPEEIREALPDGFFKADEGGGSEASLPYRRFRSSGGLEIRVGRGARRNDDLTFHHSDPDDVWMHARHAAGAHVILRWRRDGNPPARDLAEAATLAALHSKARTSGSVPVDWTRRKYVRKPRKSPPGAVVPDRVRTVFVEPDPAVEERLRDPV